MDNKTRLFGTFEKQDWIDLRIKIISNPNDKNLWIEATKLLNQRLETRYFKPIKRILMMRTTSGEGFAVMTLICSMIEFLQSCYEGKTYKFNANRETDHVYFRSGDKFKAFLEQHEPFSYFFKQVVSSPTNKVKTYADDFYFNVRCGLLHEAGTKNDWIIKTAKKEYGKIDFVDLTGISVKIIYRDRFFEEIKLFIEKYLQDIINNKQDANGRYLRDNFCRKIDCLCEISDTSTNWWV